MSSCKQCATPIDTKGKLSSKDGDDYKNPTTYKSLAIALQYRTFT